MLHISRTPVREAFIRLVEAGLLEIYPQRGSFVSLIDIEQAEEACFVRKVVEKAIIKEACESFPENDLFDLSANLAIQNFCKQEKNYEKLFQLDNEFHRIIYRGCGKERVWRHISRMNYNFDRLRIIRLSRGISWDLIIHQHEQIAQLIREKNSAQVDNAVDEHLPKAFVDELTIQHPEYFTQDVQNYTS
jgi:DNA-binding GntR family transcriptional regulator